MKNILFLLMTGAAFSLSAAGLAPMYANSVHEHYLEQVRGNARERKARLMALKTREDAEKYVAEVRRKVRGMFPLPTEKTPLNARITGTMDMGTYTISKVIYESRPGFHVTALLHLPKKAEKVPCILHLLGHTNAGKAGNTYQLVPRMFAMKGYAVLTVDPEGQGERRQMAPAGCTTEHNIHGLRLMLSGDYFCAWRAWDAIRGLNYLLSRPEVDTSRARVTGTSGGGTLTTYVNALDDRITMAAPSSYITTWVRNVENVAGVDAEQILLNAWKNGLEMADLLIAGAPHSLNILAQSNDFFDARGAQETFEDVKHIYTLLGIPGKAELTVSSGSHGYSKAHREAACAFFNRNSGLKVSAAEPENIPLSKPEELYCAPGGNVKNLPGNTSLHEFAQRRAAKVAAARKLRTKAGLRKVLLDALKIEMPGVPDYRKGQIAVTPGLWRFCFGLHTENDGRVMAMLSFPGEPETPGKLIPGRKYMFRIPDWPEYTIYIPDKEVHGELAAMNEPWKENIAGLDIRGTGDCRSLLNGREFMTAQYERHMAFYSFMLGKPYLGGKVKDILSAVELLSRNGAKIHLLARGQGAIPALMAAVLSDKIVTLKLIDAPESWASEAAKVRPEIDFPSIIPGILKETDLPELRRALEK